MFYLGFRVHRGRLGSTSIRPGSNLSLQAQDGGGISGNQRRRPVNF